MIGECIYGDECGLPADCPGCGCCCIEHPCECEPWDEEQDGEDLDAYDAAKQI